jgi:hypothetical protein
MRQDHEQHSLNGGQGQVQENIGRAIRLCRSYSKLLVKGIGKAEPEEDGLRETQEATINQ